MLTFLWFFPLALLLLLGVSLTPGGAFWPRLIVGELLILAVEIWYGAVCLALVIWYGIAWLIVWVWYRGLWLQAQTSWAVYRLRWNFSLWYLNVRLALLIRSHRWRLKREIRAVLRDARRQRAEQEKRDLHRKSEDEEASQLGDSSPASIPTPISEGHGSTVSGCLKP